MSFQNKYIKKVYNDVKKRNAGENEFLQAVKEVLETIEPVIERRPDLQQAGVVERIVEPERMIQFRVSWVDDKGRGKRQPRVPRSVQFGHRPVQGRTSSPSFRQRIGHKIPRL